MDWISERLKEFKAQGMTRQEVADAGGVSRNQTYEWEGRGKKGFSKPKAETLKAFCDGLQLDWHVPFRILGWTTPAAQPAPEPDLDLIIRRIETRLGQSPPAKERRELELRLVRTRRARDAKRLADELIADLETGLDRMMDEGA